MERAALLPSSESSFLSEAQDENPTHAISPLITKVSALSLDHRGTHTPHCDVGPGGGREERSDSAVKQLWHAKIEPHMPVLISDYLHNVVHLYLSRAPMEEICASLPHPYRNPFVG
jgi:hypothetical protein